MIVLYIEKLLIMKTLGMCRRRLEEWTAENAMKINPRARVKINPRARVKDPLNYSLGVQLITEASSCKYLRITIRNDLSCADHISYTL
jgi:hypothetical protein